MAAETDAPCSDMTTKISQKKVGLWKNEEEKRHLLRTIIKVTKSFFHQQDTISTSLSDAKKLVNLRNILLMSCHDECFFDRDLLDSYPLEIYTSVISVLCKFWGEKSLLRNGLRFLLNVFENFRTRSGKSNFIPKIK